MDLYTTNEPDGLTTAKAPGGLTRRRALAAGAAALGAAAGAGLLARDERDAAAGPAGSWKDPVRTVATGNVDLTSGLAAGSSVNGVTLVAGDRVLVAAQATASENGIYVAPPSGTASRASDALTGTDFLALATWVTESTYSDTLWLCTNDAPITVGSSAIALRCVGGGGRPIEVSLACSDAPTGWKSRCDFQLPGANDQFYFLYLMALSGGKGATFTLSPGTVKVGGSIDLANLPDQRGLTIRGAGMKSTTIKRTAGSAPILKIEGVSGIASGILISDLTLNQDGGAAPCIRISKAALVDIERVDFWSARHAGLYGNQWWDSRVRACRFDQCGTQDAASGSEYASIHFAVEEGSGNCNNVNFTDCTIESFYDGAVYLIAGGGQQHNKLYFRNTKIENNDRCRPKSAVVLDTCSQVLFDGLDVTMGAWASGVTHTPQDHIVVKGCNGLTFTHLNLEAIATTSDVSRTYLSFQGPNRAVSLSEIWCSPMASNHPSVAMLEFDPSGGANDEFHLGPATFRWDGSSGGTPLFSGLSTLTKRFDNHGEATIPTGASRKVTVTHGLRRTPQPGEISVTKADSDGGAVWVANVGATTFEIWCETAPAAALPVFWRASARDI